ncbi:MAG: hypothetical protein HYY34_06820 [Chloroflexi bacterium]|nr:hypothetical protein [Chloroflexota bacterium]
MPRINKCIELLEQGQPVFSTGASELSYDAGRALAKTEADFIMIEFEHHAFDMVGLSKFMKGLKDGGPTASGHLTPAVVTSLPSNATTREEVLANAWQTRHVLATGVHGILHTHVRDPEAAKAFVATARFPFQTLGRPTIPEGLRGGGGQGSPAPIWGVTPDEYVEIADPWPLNPRGELILGVMIEDRHGLTVADVIASTPGFSFAQWGPGDMGMSFGYPAAHDPPYPPEMEAARNTVKAALDKAGGFFFGSWNDRSMTEEQIAEHMINKIGFRMMGIRNRTFLTQARKITGRTMPV